MDVEIFVCSIAVQPLTAYNSVGVIPSAAVLQAERGISRGGQARPFSLAALDPCDI
jgi:hypothetical protein